MACCAAVVCIVPAAAAGAISTRSTAIVGNARAGKSLFVSTCGTCHTLAAAGTAGTLGPNLGAVGPSLSEVTIIDAIANGGATVMTKAAASKYSTTMAAYKSTLSKTEIDNVAAFVYSETHHVTTTKPVKVAKAVVSKFSPTRAKDGAKITVTGKNFIHVSLVKVDGLKAKFRVLSSTKLTVTVPAKAKTGKIAVTTRAGTGTSSKSLTVAK